MRVLREPKSRAVIEHRQFRKLKKLVKFAYSNSRFYRDLYQQHAFHPEDLQGIADIERIPVVDRNLLRQDLESASPGVFTRRSERHAWSQTTSGSSGIPIRIAATRYERYRLLYGMLRSYRIAGMSIFDQTLVIKDPIDLRNPLVIEKLGILRHRYFSIFEPMRTILEQIQRDPRPIDILKSMPSDLSNLVVSIENYGSAPQVNKAVFSDSETLDELTRHSIESVFRVPVLDFYANTETGIAAFQAPHSMGRYLIPDDLVILETVPNPNLLPGDYDILLTGLINRTTPIIRYRIGDVARGKVEYDQKISIFPSIERIYGKYLDFLCRRDGSLVSSHVVKQNLTHLTGIKRFQVFQAVDGKVTIFIEPDDSWNEQVRERIRSDFQRDVDSGYELEIKLSTGLGSKAVGYRKFKVVESLLAQKLLTDKISGDPS